MNQFIKSAMTVFALVGATVVNAANLTYTVDPTSGSTITAGSSFTINFDNTKGNGVEFKGSLNIEMTSAEGVVTELTGSQTSDWCGVKYAIPENMVSGDYVINIPEGKFYDYEDSNIVSPEITINYTVEGASTQSYLAYSVTPANGGTLKAGESFIVNFEAEEYDGIEAKDGNFNVFLLNTETQTYTELVGSQVNDNCGIIYYIPTDMAEGNYSVRIPEGKFYAFNNSTIVSPLIELFYEIKDVTSQTFMGCSITPGNGSTLKAGQSFTINFEAEEYDGVEAKDGNFNVVVRNSNYESVDVLVGDQVNDKCGIKYTFPTTMEEGTYFINFPQGMFYAYGNPEVISPVIDLVYTIEGMVSGETLAYTVNPESGSTLNAGDSFTINFEAEEYDGIEASDGNFNVVLMSATGTTTEIVGNQTSDFCGVTYTLPTTLSSGEYTITFPESKFYAFDAPDITSPAITITYNVLSQVTEDFLSYTVTPESGSTLKGGESFTVKFDAEDYDGVESSDGNFNVFIIAADGTQTELIGDQTTDWCGVSYTIPETLASGVYSVNFPEGKFFAYNQPNLVSPEINLTYTVTDTQTSVEAIMVNEGENAVYDLYGRCLKNRNLPAGIYILNGKKIVLK